MILISIFNYLKVKAAERRGERKSESHVVTMRNVTDIDGENKETESDRLMVVRQMKNFVCEDVLLGTMATV